MRVQDRAKEAIVVSLSPDPGMTEELEAVIETAGRHIDQDVIVDFASVGIITSSSLSRLLQLRKLMRDNGRSLVLLNVTPLTRGIFNAVGLEDLFAFGDGKARTASTQKKEGLVN